MTVPHRSGAALRLVAAGACLVAGALPGLSEQAMQVTKPSDRETAITRTFAAPRRKVFDALTQSDRVPLWFQPAQMSLVIYEADLKTGGTARYVFRRPSGKEIEMRHVYKEVEAPRRWVHVESYDFSPLQLSVTTVLTEMDGKTVFNQTLRYSSQRERDADFDSVAGSAADIYAKLERYLDSFR